ncbi:MAG: DEAD/DEAH box helicase [Blastocatellia bacterium]|nr:DEAD/DEAH box helicase [Blastocatellia bacterium]
MENKRVRLISNPSQIGVLTGGERLRGGKLLLQVMFPDNTQYIPEDKLEGVPENPEDPLDLLKAGQLEGVQSLRRTLTHVRLTGKLANVIYSMEATKADFYAYQFKPIIKILNSPTNGILIADEVGLGKTIEAGLIWTELRTRFDLKRLFVLCPAVLREKWKFELETKFGIHPRLLNARETLEAFKRLQNDPGYDDFAAIGSMQGLRSSNELFEFLDNYESEQDLVDLLVIDESHYMRNPGRTTQLGKKVRKTAAYVVLLSATPVHLRSTDLHSQLLLLDEDTFEREDAFDRILKANEPLIAARDAVLMRNLQSKEFVEHIKIASRNPLFENNRQIKALCENPPTTAQLAERAFRSRLAYQLETINLFSHVITRTRKRDVTEWRVLREPKTLSVPMTEIEDSFYQQVTEAVRTFCIRSQYLPEQLLLVMPQRMLSSSMAAALRNWQQKSEIQEDEIFEGLGDVSDQTKSQFGPLTQELIKIAGELGSYQDLFNHDSKFKKLSGSLKQFFRDFPLEKVVVFSFFRGTLDYLSERLNSIGISNIVLKGGGGSEAKVEILKRFAEPHGPSVLLSSEVGSEGIDLQFCRVLVNYDLPWNPMRIEQRIGRLDRLGQKAAKITIWNLFYEDTIDERIYERLLKRIKLFERALGGLELMLGESIHQLTFDLFSQHLTPEQEAQRIEQTAQALDNLRQVEEDLEQEATHLIAHGDFILREIQAAHDLQRWITGEDLFFYVRDFLQHQYTGCEFKQRRADLLEFDIRLSNDLKVNLEQFIRDNHLVQSRLVQNVSPYIHCRFDNKIVNLEKRIETINQFHPLVRFIAQETKTQNSIIKPAVSILLAPHHLPPALGTGIYVFAIHHWSVQGLQNLEQLNYVALNLQTSDAFLDDQQAERLILTAAHFGEDWVGAENTVELETVYNCINERCFERAEQLFSEYVRNHKNQNEDRADIQEKSLQIHWENQLSKLQAQLHHHQQKQSKLVKATEGRIRALNDRMEQKFLQIKKRRNPIPDEKDICVGLIKVWGDVV